MSYFIYMLKSSKARKSIVSGKVEELKEDPDVNSDMEEDEDDEEWMMTDEAEKEEQELEHRDNDEFDKLCSDDIQIKKTQRRWNWMKVWPKNMTNFK